MTSKLLVGAIPDREFYLTGRKLFFGESLWPVCAADAEGMWSRMFKTGDYVVYGHTGICRVMGVTTMDMSGISKDRLYYILRPDGASEGKIYTPVDGMKLVLRPIMTKEEAEALIEEIPSIQPLDIDNEKLREEKYRECIRSCECREMIRIIKTIYFRKRSRLSQGKKVTATDERYMKIAEDNLYSELSMLLDVPRNKMETYLSARLKDSEKA